MIITHFQLRFLFLFSFSFCIGLAQGQPQASPAPATPAAPSRHDTVVVTGTYEPLSIDEIDRSVTLLPARSMELVLNSLVDLLQQDPSLDLQERAPDGVQTDLSIRGANFEQTLVLLNGQRLNDVQTGHHDMDIPVPLDSVERVEVLRGSGSAMYGSDASGGVINVITAPPEGLELRLRTAVGNDGVNQQQASFSDTFGSLSEQLSFARDFSSGFMPDRDYRNLQLASDTHLITAWGPTDLTLAYMDHPFGAAGFYGDYPSWEDTKTWWAGFQQALGKKTVASFAYRRHSDLYVLYRDDPSIYTNHHADESEQMAVRRTETVATGTNAYYGVEALHESIVSNNLGTHARSRGAAYAAMDFRALRRFSLSLAAREEVYRNFAATLCPTIAGGVWISGKLKFRASASRAFRVPTYTDLYYNDPVNHGNPYLQPESSWSYESGIDWNPGGRVRAALTLFQRREHNDIDYYSTSIDGPWQALNIDRLIFTGVESSLRLVLTRSETLDLRYDWLLGVQDTVPIGYTKYAFNYPTDSAVVAWQASLPGGIVARSRLSVLNRRGRDPYALWDLYLASSRGKIHPFIRVANITNTDYQEILGVPMPGREAMIGTELLFHGH
jgi:iron complex outermembrane receptor protein